MGDKITVYLDNCCFNRPYDDQGHLSIYLETQAKLAIQELVKDQGVFLFWSFILDYENQANPDEVIKNEIFLWRKNAADIVASNNQIIENAKKYVQSGLGKKDALHLASALEAKCDYFITVDKGILRKTKQLDNIIVCSPIEFIGFWEDKK
ncbi:MAG: PIN domain protein [Gammaproteobacteria bacterium]|nr:PIN domain protein [Gammaproteobacteria bacterium]